MQNISKFQTTHICFEEIAKEKNINSDILKFSENLSKIFLSIKKATDDYCTKINQIIECLKVKKEKKDKYLIISDIKNYIYFALKEITDTIKKLITKVELQNEKEETLNNKESELHQAEQYLQMDISKMEFNKIAYYQEFKNFELYIVEKELEENGNENEEGKEKTIIKKDKDKNKDKDEDNFSNIMDFQKSYFDMNETLKTNLKKILNMVYIKRKFIVRTIFNKFQIFLGCIYNIGEKINKKTIDKNMTKAFEVNEESTNHMDERVNNIFKVEPYTFKFLSEFSSIKEFDKELKNKNKNLNNSKLLSQLEDKNIENIVKKLKTYDIKYSEKNLEQLDVLKNNEIIKTKIEQILNSPVKFVQNEKQNLLDLIKSSEQNQFFCLQYLNNYRATGNLNLRELTINIFCEIFLFIFNSGISSKNFKIIQLIIILCQTYYHEKESTDENSSKNDEEGKKLYMVSYMKNWQIFRNKNFWKSYLDELIEDEIKKINPNKNNNVISANQITTAIYSSIFTLTKNMVDFGLEMDFIISITNEGFDKYNLSDNLKKDIINYLIEELQAPIK